MGTNVQVGGECRHGLEQFRTVRVDGLPGLGFGGVEVGPSFVCALSHGEVRVGRVDARLPEVADVVRLRKLWRLAGLERRPVIERLVGRLLAEADAPVDDTQVRQSQRVAKHEPALPGVLADQVQVMLDGWLADALEVEAQGVANGAWLAAAADMADDGWEFDLNLVVDSVDHRFEWESLDEPGRNRVWLEDQAERFWDDSQEDEGELEFWQEQLLQMLDEVDS